VTIWHPEGIAMKATRRLGAVMCSALLAASLGHGVASGGDRTERETEQRNLIAFSRFNPVRDSLALFRARPDGSHRRRMTHRPAFFPDWSPDRKRMVFDFPDAKGNEQIATVRADGSGFRRLTHLPGISEVARFSPDGKVLVFDRSPILPDDPDFFTSLWVMKADGDHPRPLFKPDPDKFDVEPEFSPNGRRIVFARLRISAAGVQKAAIFTVRADGTGERRVTRFMPGLEHPRWAPDGRHIVYNVDLGDTADPAGGIWQIGADGSDADQILPGSSELLGFKPVFSPNGRRILFGCFVVAQEQDDLCVMRADGSRVRNITRTPRIFENFPAWR
jgi:Tol biopolymer transport system component